MHALRLGAAYAATLTLFSIHAQAQQSEAVAAEPAAPPKQTATANALARDAYVRAVLAANPSVESARQAWRAARAREEQAGAFEDPMIQFGMAPLSIGSSMRFGFDIGISQQLPWFGKRALERDVMTAEAAAAESDIESVRRELAMTAVSLYDRYYVAFRSLEINSQHVQLMQSMRTAASTQYEAGRGSANDALQAEAELTQLERQAAVLEADRDVLVAQMNELLHRDPSVPLSPPVDALVPAGSADVQDPKELEQAAIARRPEITSARFRVRAEASKAEAAGRAYYPNIMLETSYSTMWDMPEHRWMVGVGVNIPLPTDARSGAIDEAHAARAQYEREIERMSDMVKTQVYVATRRIRESEHVLLLFQTRLLPVAREQVSVAHAGFIASQTAFMTVVQAERNLRSVELEQKMVEAEHAGRKAELDRALGRIPGLGAEEAQP